MALKVDGMVTAARLAKRVSCSSASKDVAVKGSGGSRSGAGGAAGIACCDDEVFRWGLRYSRSSWRCANFMSVCYPARGDGCRQLATVTGS